MTELMNREIEFRGKRVDNDEWVYGFLSRGRLQGYRGNTLQPCIDHEENGVMLSSVVDPSTVGQFTEFVRNKRIYEDDICDTHTKFGKGVVIFKNGMFKINEISLCTFTDLELIGNIHDDLELEPKSEFLGG